MKLIIECTAEECAELLKLKANESYKIPGMEDVGERIGELYASLFHSPNYD